ncbi:MAG TPA: CpsB/CapC family capsule biosynthesis tyrosine phosphatase [Gemmatimonadales bacterium]|nr:CpsB/CapC family capsule biosynthesis tyrosine phosphatase [Gemmatimonadales bacterium]
MIDLHSHLLPGVDDGSRSVEQSVGVLRTMARQGVTAVCLTPHVVASRAAQGVPPAHDRAFLDLTAQAPPEVRLVRGAEVMLDRPLYAADAQPFTIGGSRYILVEFPRMIAEEAVRNALAILAGEGLVPLLAHPERYSSCSVEAARRWKAAGAKLQVDATTLLSPEPRGERARALVIAGLADIMAADNHGDTRSIATGAQALREHRGELQAELLSTTNPAAILADGELEPVPPLAIRATWGQRLRRLFEPRDP